MPAPSPADGLKTLVTRPVLTAPEVQIHMTHSLGAEMGLESRGTQLQFPAGPPPPRRSCVCRAPVLPAAKGFPDDAVGPVNTALLAPSASPELLAGGERAPSQLSRYPHRQLLAERQGQCLTIFYLPIFNNTELAALSLASGSQ